METFDALSYTCPTSSDHDIPLFVTYHINAHTIYAHHSLLSALSCPESSGTEQVEGQACAPGEDPSEVGPIARS